MIKTTAFWSNRSITITVQNDQHSSKENLFDNLITDRAKTRSEEPFKPNVTAKLNNNRSVWLGKATFWDSKGKKSYQGKYFQINQDFKNCIQPV